MIHCNKSVSLNIGKQVVYCAFLLDAIDYTNCDIMKNGDNFLPSHYMFTMYVLPIKFPVWHWKSMQFQVKKLEKSVTFHIPTLLFTLYIVCRCHLCIPRLSEKNRCTIECTVCTYVIMSKVIIEYHLGNNFPKENNFILDFP